MERLFFRLCPPLDNWQSLVLLSGDEGDLAIYSGPSGATVNYSDGSVFDQVGLAAGFDGVSVDHNSQIDVVHPHPGGLGWNADDGYGRVTFHSHRYSYSSSVTANDMNNREEEVVVSPWISVGRTLWQNEGNRINSHVSYSFAQSTIRSAPVLTTQQDIVEQHKEYSYAYDMTVTLGGTGPFPNAPFTFALPKGPAIIYDETLAFGGGVSTDPSTSSDLTSSIKDSLLAFSQGSVDIVSHTIGLTAELQHELSDSFTLTVESGPTLTIVDWRTDYTIEWQKQSTGSSVLCTSESASDVDMLVGFTIQSGLFFDTGDTSPWFAAANVGYEWQNKLDVNTDHADVDLDMSSMFGSISGGVRL